MSILRALNKAARKGNGVRVEQAATQIAEAQAYATLALVDAIDALRYLATDRVVEAIDALRAER